MQNARSSASRPGITATLLAAALWLTGRRVAAGASSLEAAKTAAGTVAFQGAGALPRESRARVPYPARQTRLRTYARRATPLAVAAAVAAWVLLQANWTATPDGDPALHLKLIQDIASTHQLPSVLPHFPARVGDGGEVQAMFPYAYPPLYHLVGAFAYAIAGLPGVLAINAGAAAVIALVMYAFVARAAPRYIAAAAALMVVVAPVVMATMRSPYMEPLMLAFLFPGAWYTYLALTTRRWRLGLFAGVLLGLSIATRQNALAFVLVIAAVVAAHLWERGAWRPRRWRSELPWLLAICAGGILAAGPGLLYLAHTNGTIGYADLSIPGMTPSLPIDPAANDYVAAITKPQGSTLDWLNRYRYTLIYTEGWMPRWYSIVPMMFFVLGAMRLSARGGAGRFLARWAVAQLLLDMLVFTTLHGSGRYGIVTQVLFYALVPVGLYALLRHLAAWVELRRGVRLAALAVAGALVPVSLFWLFPVGTSNWYLYSRTEDADLRAFRGTEYADMGSWVNANTPTDSLILTPRTYTAELTWDRDVTWVTFYGNAWVVEALATPDPDRARDILANHGVDYVLIPDPPGSYIDTIPSTGMRSYLQLGIDPPSSFELVHLTDSGEEPRPYTSVVDHGLRLYRVVADQRTS